MKSPLAAAIAAFQLATPPEFTACRITRTRLSRLDQRSSSSAVPSVEASSATTISSGARDCPSAAVIASRTIAARL